MAQSLFNYGNFWKYLVRIVSRYAYLCKYPVKSALKEICIGNAFARLCKVTPRAKQRNLWCLHFLLFYVCISHFSTFAFLVGRAHGVSLDWQAAALTDSSTHESNDYVQLHLTSCHYPSFHCTWLVVVTTHHYIWPGNHPLFQKIGSYNSLQSYNSLLATTITKTNWT